MTLAVAFSALSADQRAELFGMVDIMPNVAVEPVGDAFDSLDLAELVTLVGSLDASAAHALTAARKLDMEIVTLDRVRWRPVEERLPWPAPLVEAGLTWSAL